MKNQQSSPKSKSFIFNIDVLVEGAHNAEALEHLLQALNKNDFVDYRIRSGIQLGEKIDERLANAISTQEIPVSTSVNHQEHALSPSLPDTGIDKIRTLIKDNTLIRLHVNKGYGIKLSIPCRILNIDEQAHLITVYHVDEKRVYTFRTNEIEDFTH